MPFHVDGEVWKLKRAVNPQVVFQVAVVIVQSFALSQQYLSRILRYKH